MWGDASRWGQSFTETKGARSSQRALSCTPFFRLSGISQGRESEETDLFFYMKALAESAEKKKGREALLWEKHKVNAP